jgi:dTDP-glucose 4,6-dehydratase
MTRVLITGGAGFVGHHLVEHLLETTDWDLVVLDSLTYAGRVDRLTSAKGFDPDRVTLLWHDLRAPIHGHLNDRIGDVSAVLHLAAESHVDRSILDPVPFVRNNVDATLTMLQWARVRELSHFVQVSTDEVYGPAVEGQRHVEWDPVIPSNPYSASKAAQEALAISYWRTYGVPVVLTNFMNMIGERQDVEKFVPKVVRAVLRGDTVPLHARPVSVRPGRGDVRWEPSSRHWLHARNYADALRWMLTDTTPAAYPQADRPDRWHVAGEELDVLQLAERIAVAAGRELRYEFVDYHGSRPGHDHRYALDPSKIHAAGWKPPVPLGESLERTVRWMIAHPEWLNE